MMSEVKEKEVVKADYSKTEHESFMDKLAKSHGIKPLRGAETAMYVPVNIKQDPDTRRTLVPTTVQVNHNTTILHPHTKLPVKLVYVKAERPVKTAGVVHMEQEIGEIFINNGALIVTAKDQALYYHMEMSDENESKPNRDTRVRAKYRRVDKEKSAEQVIDEEFKLEYVLRQIRESDVEDIEAMAKIHRISIDRTIAEIKRDLIVIAKKDPMAFITMSPNPKDKIKVVIENAKGSGFITYNGVTRKWSVNSKDGEREILEIEVGGNSEEGLIEYLSAEKKGRETLKELKELLKGNV